MSELCCMSSHGGLFHQNMSQSSSNLHLWYKSLSKLSVLTPKFVKVCIPDTNVRQRLYVCYQSSSKFITNRETVHRSSSTFVKQFIKLRQRYSLVTLVPGTRCQVPGKPGTRCLVPGAWYYQNTTVLHGQVISKLHQHQIQLSSGWHSGQGSIFPGITRQTRLWKMIRSNTAHFCCR